MRYLSILCALLIIAVCASAKPYKNEVEEADELSEDIDSPESLEDGTLDADMNNLYKPKSHDHSKEKKKPHEHSKEKKKPHEHSKEKKKPHDQSKEKKKPHEDSKEKKKPHDQSKEKKKPHEDSKEKKKPHDQSKEKKKPHEHSKEKKSKEQEHSKEKKSKERDYSEEESEESNNSQESNESNNSQESNESNESLESNNRPKTISDDATFLPHEKFCKYFYAFDDMEARLLSCPRGHRFDSEKLQCLKKKEVDCGKRKKNANSSEEKARINFKCPKWSGLHKHEYYCNLYYSCLNKKAQLFKCPQGKLFDDRNNKCADRGNVACNKRIDPNDDGQRPTMKPDIFECPSKSGKYPHERDCSAFYKCDNRRYKIQYCSKGKLYNERKRNCEPEHKVTCGRRIHPDLDPDEPEDKVIDPKPNYKCNKNFGRYNHDDYCNWYYQCHDKLPSIRECRRGRRYDRHRRKCIVKDEVICDGKPDKEDVTTEKATTTQISTETPTPTEIETTPTEIETTPTEPETTPTEEPTTPEPTTTEEPTTPEPTTTEEPTTPEPTTTEEPTTPEPTTTEEPTTTKRPKVTAPDTDCDEDDVDCIIEDLGETPDWFVCPDFLGSYPHPSSKRLFIFCINWKPSVKRCGQDLVFSEDLATCVHP